jgi:hypothetical protein
MPSLAVTLPTMTTLHLEIPVEFAFFQPECAQSSFADAGVPPATAPIARDRVYDPGCA